MDEQEKEVSAPAPERKRGGFASVLLGDANARDAVANAKLDRKFRKKQLQREDNEGEREFKARRRSERLASFRASCINVARAAVVVGPITAPMSVAWTGQIGFATGVLAWPFAGGVLYAAAYELTTVFCGWLYHEARKDGDGGFVYRLAMWAFAAGAAAQQWWHYMDPDGTASYRSVTFASMTLVGVIVFELFARLVHRRKLRRDGKVDDSRPRFGLMRWLRYPRRTFDAWSLTIQDPTRFNTVDLAWSEADRVAIQRGRRKTARRLARSTAGPAQVGRGRRWFRRQTTEIGPIPAEVRVDRPEIRPETPADPARSEQPKPQVETPVERPALEAGETSKDEGVKPPANPEPTSSNDADEFQPTDLERQAVALLVETDRSINRANCADAVRELEGGIATKRAAQLAAWGRENNGGNGPRAVRAV